MNLIIERQYIIASFSWLCLFYFSMNSYSTYFTENWSNVFWWQSLYQKFKVFKWKNSFINIVTCCCEFRWSLFCQYKLKENWFFIINLLRNFFRMFWNSTESALQVFCWIRCQISFWQVRSSHFSSYGNNLLSEKVHWKSSIDSGKTQRHFISLWPMNY